LKGKVSISTSYPEILNSSKNKNSRHP